MSDQAPPGAEVGGTSQPVVQVGGDSSRIVTRKAKFLRMALLVVGLLIIIAAGTFGMMKWLDHTHKVSQQKTAETKLSAQTKTVTNTAVQAEDLQNQGNTGQAIKAIQAQIAATADSNTKAQLYVLEGDTYLNANDYADALKAGQLSEQALPSPGSAQLMGASEVGLGDKSKAITYYQTAESRDKQIGDYSGYLDMQAAIKDLQQ